MTGRVDPLDLVGKTDAQRALEEVQAIVDRLDCDEASTVGFVRIRVAVIMSLVVGLAGFILGHVQ